MVAAPPRRFERYVALGDSSAEGLVDPDGAGGFRGWADRLADRVAAAQGPLLYANLAVRGRRTRAIREEQLSAALALRPDLATIFAGTNDVIARDFDLEATAADAEAIQSALAASGATILTFTLPDLGAVLPLARRVAPRVVALNERLRAIAARTGARLVDFESHPVALDPRLWHADRLHANSEGHARIAAALAHALGLPGTDDAWGRPLPPARPAGRAARLAAEVAWSGRYLVPWAWRHLFGRSSGDGRGPKRPALLPVAPLAAHGRR
jgi:lysophospholipase L1-like esterase